MTNITEQKVAQYLVFFNSKFSSTENFIEIEPEINHQKQVGSESDDEEVVMKKRRGNKVWVEDEDEEEEENKEENIEENREEMQEEDNKSTEGQKKKKSKNEFGLKNFYTKKIALKIWGFYNEKLKQSWEKYLLNSKTSGSLYLSTALFIDIVCKYISRKKAKVENQSLTLLSRLKKRGKTKRSASKIDTARRGHQERGKDLLWTAQGSKPSKDTTSE